MTPPHSSLWYFGPHGPLGPSGDPVALTRTASILIHSLRSRMDVSRTLDHQGFLRTILISSIMHDGKGMFRVLGSGVMVKLKFCFWIRLMGEGKGGSYSAPYLTFIPILNLAVPLR